jgi:hypothetical protein
MKVPLGVFLIPFLVALLTWLSIRAVNPEAEQYDRVLRRGCVCAMVLVSRRRMYHFSP